MPIMTERCTMPTRKLQACKRRAIVRYERDGRTIAQYCAQHDRTPGARYLRPFPWEYDSRLLEVQPGLGLWVAEVQS